MLENSFNMKMKNAFDVCKTNIQNKYIQYKSGQRLKELNKYNMAHQTKFVFVVRQSERWKNQYKKKYYVNAFVLIV